MTVTIAVQVTADDQDELITLAQSQPGSSDVATIRPFDGTTMCQIVVPMATSGLAMFKIWMKSRVELRKNTKIVRDGIVYDGLTEAQVDKILLMLGKELKDDGADGV